MRVERAIQNREARVAAPPAPTHTHTNTSPHLTPFQLNTPLETQSSVIYEKIGSLKRQTQADRTRGSRQQIVPCRVKRASRSTTYTVNAPFMLLKCFHRTLSVKAHSRQLLNFFIIFTPSDFDALRRGRRCSRGQSTIGRR